MNGIDRRLFLKTMAASGAGLLPAAWYSRVSEAAGQSPVRLKQEIGEKFVTHSCKSVGKK